MNPYDRYHHHQQSPMDFDQVHEECGEAPAASPPAPPSAGRAAARSVPSSAAAAVPTVDSAGPPNPAPTPLDDTLFPSKLHAMLHEAPLRDFVHIVSWGTDSPRGFRVHHKRDFERHILPQYFKMTKYKSFTRQLHNYEFQWIREGNDKSGYMHPAFHRDDASSCANVTRRAASRNDAVVRNGSVFSETSMDDSTSATSELRLSQSAPERSFSYMKSNSMDPLSSSPPTTLATTTMMSTTTPRALSSSASSIDLSTQHGSNNVAFVQAFSSAPTRHSSSSGGSSNMRQMMFSDNDRLVPTYQQHFLMQQHQSRSIQQSTQPQKQDSLLLQSYHQPPPSFLPNMPLADFEPRTIEQMMMDGDGCVQNPAEAAAAASMMRDSTGFMPPRSKMYHRAFSSSDLHDDDNDDDDDDDDHHRHYNGHSTTDPKDIIEHETNDSISSRRQYYCFQPPNFM